LLHLVGSSVFILYAKVHRLLLQINTQS